MNAIYTNQSTRENMDLLYAQARVYDRVKNWNRLNFLFSIGNDSNLLIVFYVQIMPDDFVMQLHRF